MKTPPKSLHLILKIIVGLGVVTFLLFKIKNEPVLENLKRIEILNYNYLVIAFLLLFVNWGLESKKWQLLIRPVQYISFFRAYKSVLAGLTTGLFTPNRLGNFIGRLAFIKKDNHNAAIVNTLIGNLAQFVSTLLLGIIGFFILLYLKYDILNSALVIVLSCTLTGLALSLYFKPSLINFSLLNKLFSDKTKISIQQVEQTAFNLKINVLSISILRYMVFCVQYYLLFLAFMPANPLLFFGLITSTFLITTLIPSFFFGKLFVRESVAIFVFSLANIDTTLVLLVAFLLWMINLALPAIVGALLWIKQKQHV